jgi:hypothetical protein
MITPIEPLPRARIQSTHKEEELPADVSLRRKKRKLRQNENINTLEHIVIIISFLQSYTNSY